MAKFTAREGLHINQGWCSYLSGKTLNKHKICYLCLCWLKVQLIYCCTEHIYYRQAINKEREQNSSKHGKLKRARTPANLKAGMAIMMMVQKSNLYACAEAPQTTSGAKQLLAAIQAEGRSLNSFLDVQVDVDKQRVISLLASWLFAVPIYFVSWHNSKLFCGTPVYCLAFSHLTFSRVCKIIAVICRTIYFTSVFCAQNSLNAASACCALGATVYINTRWLKGGLGQAIYNMGLLAERKKPRQQTVATFGITKRVAVLHRNFGGNSRAQCVARALSNAKFVLHIFCCCLFIELFYA